MKQVGIEETIAVQPDSEIRVWQVGYNHPYPWRFAVIYKGVRHDYVGVPNYCTSRQSAIMRGVWRRKWLREGTYDHHYQAV